MNIYRIIFSFILVFMFMSCNPDNDTSDTPISTDYIELEYLTKTIDYTINEFPLTVSANCEWKVFHETDWLEIDPDQEMYNESEILHFRADRNESTVDRVAVVYFTNILDTLTLTITQTAFDVYLASDVSDIDFGYRAAEKIIRVSSNCGWTATADKNWIAIRPSTGLVGSYEMVVNVEKNLDPQDRTGQIHIRNEKYAQDLYISVNQEGNKVENNISYIDEHGIDRGYGVQLFDLIWAPVNCGYHEEDYKYGKMYQWGRNNGLAYHDEYYKDAETTSISEVWNGLNGEEHANTFYKASTDSGYAYDWIIQGDNKYWNLGTEENPQKNDKYDPCPEGWRVPTRYEFRQLIENAEVQWTEVEGKYGFTFTDPDAEEATVFLPAGGRLNVSDGLGYDRNIEGYYWTNTSFDAGSSAYLYFYKENIILNIQGSRAGGCLLRCVRG